MAMQLTMTIRLISFSAILCKNFIKPLLSFCFSPMERLRGAAGDLFFCRGVRPLPKGPGLHARDIPPIVVPGFQNMLRSKLSSHLLRVDFTLGKQDNRLNMCVFVPTQAHIFLCRKYCCKLCVKSLQKRKPCIFYFPYLRYSSVKTPPLKLYMFSFLKPYKDPGKLICGSKVNASTADNFSVFPFSM